MLILNVNCFVAADMILFYNTSNLLKKVELKSTLFSRFPGWVLRAVCSAVPV
jgi:hypothetical protein